jgi:hypothetical protein
MCICDNMAKKASNKNLHSAKKDKKDEFYTQLPDIEKEMCHYKNHFKNKIVFCNCDDPEESNFWKYFSLNFEKLGLKKLVSTHYETDKPSYKLEIVRDINNDGKINQLDTIKTPLTQNGDFRSPECIEILKEADIVVTNPPFSIFREYMAQLMEHDKKFLIIGPINAITYKEVFPLIKNNEIWLGYKSGAMSFIKPDKNVQDFGNICWFTNLDVKKRRDELILYKKYNPKDYPKYDNYDAINVDRVTEIPEDYYGAMGVPITFLDKYNPEQFEIINSNDYKYRADYHDNPTGLIKSGDGAVCGRITYARILIKRR